MEFKLVENPPKNMLHECANAPHTIPDFPLNHASSSHQSVPLAETHLTSGPPGPPPLLTEDDLAHLIIYGYLPVTLPSYLASLCARLASTASTFFDQPFAHKRSLYPTSDGTELGFYNVPGEKQYLTLRHQNQRRHPLEEQGSTSLQQPADIGQPEQAAAAAATPALHHQQEQQEDLEPLVAETWMRTAHYLHRILADISRALDIPPTAWDPVVRPALLMPAGPNHPAPSIDASDTEASKSSVASKTSNVAVGDSPTLLRMFRYEPERGVASEHTDGGLLTLCVGGSRGLQCRRRVFPIDGNTDPSMNQYSSPSNPSTHATTSNGTSTAPSSPPQTSSEPTWDDTPGPTILIGRTLRILTFNRCKAGVHRVIANPLGRESVVFALRPALNCVLDLGAFGAEGHKVDMKELYRQILATRFNVNADKGVRERQREKLRKGLETGRFEDGEEKDGEGGKMDEEVMGHG